MAQNSRPNDDVNNWLLEKRKPIFLGVLSLALVASIVAFFVVNFSSLEHVTISTYIFGGAMTILPLSGLIWSIIWDLKKKK